VIDILREREREREVIKQLRISAYFLLTIIPNFLLKNKNPDFGLRIFCGIWNGIFGKKLSVFCSGIPYYIYQLKKLLKNIFHYGNGNYICCETIGKSWRQERSGEIFSVFGNPEGETERVFKLKILSLVMNKYYYYKSLQGLNGFSPMQIQITEPIFINFLNIFIW
jgi:hypothetical protein